MAWPTYQQNLQHTGLYDTTAPTTPVIRNREGFIRSRQFLYASWETKEKESGISLSEYKITEGSSDGAVVKSGVVRGPFNYVTAGGLNLTIGKTYYFSVRAKNGAGLWSGWGHSEGITVVKTPPIIINRGADGTGSSIVTLRLSAPESNAVMMRLSNDGKTWFPAKYSATALWDLNDGFKESSNGLRTVYVQFQYPGGDWSTTYSNSMFLRSKEK